MIDGSEFFYELKSLIGLRFLFFDYKQQRELRDHFEFKEKMDAKAGENENSVNRDKSACDVEALQKCLKENKGSLQKCQAQIEAFKSSCGVKKPNS